VRRSCGGRGAALDASVDESVDMLVEASLDASMDMSVDASLDASMDMSVDASLDASPDAALGAYSGTSARGSQPCSRAWASKSSPNGAGHFGPDGGGTMNKP
jgi:hypothetical protein